MPYNEPGVRPIQQFVNAEVAPIEAELATIVIGPLYEVFEQEASSTDFDPLTVANQVYTWPNLRVGTVVDLAGVRNGLIDSQRKDLAPYVPAVTLVDGETRHEVADENIEVINQTGFELTQAARTNLDRGSFDFWILTINNEELLYNPAGGLGTAQIGDRLSVGSVGPTLSTIDSVSDTQLTVTEDISGEVQVSVDIEEDEGGSVTVVVAPAATAGRVTITLTGTDFVTEVPAIATGDVAVTAIPMTGLTTMAGAIIDGDASYDDLENVVFGVDISLEEIDNYVVRVVNSTVGQTYFTKLVAIDTTAGTMTVADAVGTADADVVAVTVMRSQVGHIESINVTNTEITVIVPETFATTAAFVDIYTTATTEDIYPTFDVEVDYRAARIDISDTLLSAGSNTELLETLDHSSVDSNDSLAFAVNTALLAQPNERNVYFIVVDAEPDGTTGLPENRDLTTGYQNALDIAESSDVYCICLLDRSAAIDSALQAHVTSMSDETDRAWRRGFFVTDVPLGATESGDGLVEIGRTVDGLAPLGTEGNTTIRDAGVQFSTGAGVVAGTRVVVTYPPELAGDYVADGATTDDALILASDTVWPIVKEFDVSGTADLNTGVADVHTLSGGSITATQFAHVEAGDYVELTESATVYRLKVISATLNTLTLSDDVAGSITFTGTGTNASDITVIRTWGTSNGGGVEYHISPLTKTQQVAELLASKSLADRRFTLILDQDPTMQTGTDTSGDPVNSVLDPSLTCVALAAKRSGSSSSDEVTNLTMEGGISKVKYGYNYFKRSQLNTLAEAGFTLIVQKSETAEPYIRDMITTAGYAAGLVNFEELVTSTIDWISKTLVNTFGTPIGARLPKLTPRLLGVRTLQVSALFDSWVEEGRLSEYTINKVERDSLNPRQTNIDVSVVVTLAEKEIEFIIQTTV